MSYTAVAVYSLDGDFLGYTIKGSHKLQTTNLYGENEMPALNEQLARLNEDVDLRQTWPHPQDPEVLAIVEDESFMPIEYVETDVVDEEHSYLVWTKEMETDDRGEPTGNLVDGAEIDEEASVIRYKRGKVPKNPSDVMWRIKAASEIVARQRAEAATINR